MEYTFSEIAQKTAAELHALLAESREELRGAQFAVRQGGLKKVHQIRLLRQRVAQVLTALNTKRT